MRSGHCDRYVPWLWAAELISGSRLAAVEPVCLSHKGHKGRGGSAAAGEVIDAISNCAGLEFAADDMSIAYTMQDAAGRPSQVCPKQTA